MYYTKTSSHLVPVPSGHHIIFHRSHRFLARYCLTHRTILYHFRSCPTFPPLARPVPPRTVHVLLAVAEHPIHSPIIIPPTLVACPQAGLTKLHGPAKPLYAARLPGHQNSCRRSYSNSHRTMTTHGRSCGRPGSRRMTVSGGRKVRSKRNIQTDRNPEVEPLSQTFVLRYDGRRVSHEAQPPDRGVMALRKFPSATHPRYILEKSPLQNPFPRFHWGNTPRPRKDVRHALQYLWSR